jgi:hypothetical protein
MAAGQGKKIQLSDYTSIKNKVDAVFGTGSGDSGYGQQVTSTTPVTGDLISHVEWVELRNDMVKARQHQTGFTVGSTTALDGGNLVIVTTGTTITEAIRNQYDNFSNIITADRLLIATSVSQSNTTANSITSKTYTSEWNNALVHVIAITGNNATPGSTTNLRYFFNAGGTIDFSSSIVGATSTVKNLAWQSFLSDIGVVKFGNTFTKWSGSSNNLGWSSLTTNDLVVFEAHPVTYSLNSYKISVRKTSDNSQIIATVTFNDGDGSDADTNVNGTLLSMINQTTPTGNNVSVPAVILDSSYGNNNTFIGGAPISQYYISPSALSIAPGNVVMFSIASKQLPVESSITWAIETSGMTADEFEENILSGGPITLTNGTGSFSLTSKNTGTDARASQVFTVKLKNNGTTVAESVAVTLGAVATSYYSTPGTFAWTVPSSVSRLVISAVGGGGGSYGWHDSGYGTWAVPGGSGGGVDGVAYQVVPGTSTSIVIGDGGGFGVQWTNSGYGTPGTPTSFTYNGTRVFICDQGPMASGQTVGGPGSATIDASNTGGVVRQGTSGIANSGGNYDGDGPGGYNVWYNIDHRGYSISYAGTQAIYPPAAIADRARAGLVQYHGWMAITQIPETIYNWTTYGSHTFTVPAGVTTILVQITGGSGGSGSGDGDYSGHAGFAGDYVSGYLTVTPGQVITAGIGGLGGNGGTGTETAGGVAGASIGSSTSFSGGRGGSSGTHGTSGSGGGGGGASFVLVNGNIIAVAGGGGGGGGAGRNSHGYGQITGTSSTTTGASGGDKGGADGGGGGGGGGGYQYGGAGGPTTNDDYGAYSGANGQSLVPSGWTSTAGSNAGTAGIVYIKY